MCAALWVSGDVLTLSRIDFHRKQLQCRELDGGKVKVLVTYRSSLRSECLM